MNLFLKKFLCLKEDKVTPLTTGDYLRIASAGLDILGRPSEGGGFKGALATVSKPLAELGVDIGRSIDTREAKSLEDLQRSRKTKKRKNCSTDRRTSRKWMLEWQKHKVSLPEN